MTLTITIPAREVLRGTSRVPALEASGFVLDRDGDAPRIYPRGERPPGCGAQLVDCCVMRREA